MSSLITIRKFPRGMGAMPLGRIARRRLRGVGQSDAAAALELMIPGLSTLVNETTGQESSLDLIGQEGAGNAAIVQAATNPTTGQTNQSLVQSEQQQLSYEMPLASDVSNLSTGSWPANLLDSATGNYTLPVGYPGTTPPLGSPNPNPVQTFDQFFLNLFGGGSNDPTSSFPWGTVILAGVLIVGGIIVVKDVL